MKFMEDEFAKPGQGNAAAVSPLPISTAVSPHQNRLPAPPLEQIPIHHLEMFPGEKKTVWNSRVRKAAEAALRRKQEVARSLAKRLPVAEVGRATVAHKALVLALSGVPWTEIFDHYKHQAGCKWSRPNSAMRGAELIANKLGLKWPLKLKRTGRPRRS
jgi:hypothetical protein